MGNRFSGNLQKKQKKPAPIFSIFSRATIIFYQKRDKGFVFKTSKCMNPENFIQIGALSKDLPKVSLSQNFKKSLFI
jgi:hypothetical protein